MGLGSEIRDPEKPIPDPGSRGQKAPDPGSGPATLKQTIPSWKCYFAWKNSLVPYSVDRKEAPHVYFALLLSSAMPFEIS
jgi:hypothetical protein